MVNIKNLVLKLLAVILLIVSLTSMVFYITFSNAVNDLNSLKNSVKTPLGLAVVSEYDIKKSFGEGKANNLLDGATTDLYKQAVLLKGIANYLLIVLIIAYLVSLLLVYLINMEIVSTIETFSYYNFILSLIIIFGIVVTYFVVPAIGNAAIGALLKESEIGTNMEGTFKPLLNLFITWLKEIILRPIYLFGPLAIVSLVGWRTRFWIKGKD
ncbi:hypothetical protein HYT84_04865 [Candidatus Micrarchaeota archaeon]|nr:hypothetical protein [Candidatus Micrarchaeota archaeon]